MGDEVREDIDDADVEQTADEAEATVEADLVALAAERDDFRELAQRVQADFENYRKRMLREQTDKMERANEGLVEQLLSVLDSFELALSNIPNGDGDADEKVRKGVELVYAELLGVLEKSGLERIDAFGKPFDPHEHEAVAQEDGDGEPVVCDILRSGYRLKGRVLRPATVRVTRAGA
ncbi:MAG: nucleotide exchange factor GrpE [Acidimicrobiia bacterium]|nr:nucleotide exchange factor GrpE [Acidimicrobiia bacterium]